MNTELAENMSEFLNAYITCALWSSVNDNGEPLDSGYFKEDIDPDSLMLMTIDCYNFYVKNFQDDCPPDYSLSQAGHDFWLTRNGHGAGYWDRGLGHDGDVLTTRAQAEGEVSLYVAANNIVYYS